MDLSWQAEGLRGFRRLKERSVVDSTRFGNESTALDDDLKIGGIAIDRDP